MPDDPAGSVLQEGGGVWAEYYYRGLTAGGTAAVLDLKRIFPEYPQYGPTIVGFDVVDLGTMLPELLVLDAGITARIERISCTRS